MTDIVKRLRAACVDHPEYGKTTTLAVQYDELMEAANEIERLRAALHRIAHSPNGPKTFCRDGHEEAFLIARAVLGYNELEDFWDD